MYQTEQRSLDAFRMLLTGILLEGHVFRAAKHRLNFSHCLVREVIYCDVPRLGKAADRNVLRDLHFTCNVQAAIWRLARTVCTC
jgi:hypothetical protein